MTVFARALELIRKYPERWIVAIILTLAAIPRIYLLIYDQGVYYPDEIYQALEQSHRFAYGYGFIPWEFRTLDDPAMGHPGGARSWVFPGAVGLVMKLGRLLGFSGGVSAVLIAKGFMMCLGLFAIWQGMQLGKKLGDRYGMVAAGTALAFFPASFVFSNRTMGEVAAGALVLASANAAWDKGRRAAIIAGALAATAIFCRYQTGVFGVVIGLMILFSRRWKDFGWFSLSAIVFGMLGGAVDWVTWGAPFHAFKTYVEFNYTQAGASNFGISEAPYYFEVIKRSTGPLIWILLIGLVLSLRHARWLPAACVFFVYLHMKIPHKELRFITPAFPLALALAGGGLGWLFTKIPWGGWMHAALVACLGAGLYMRCRTMTLYDLGFFGSTPREQITNNTLPEVHPWHLNEGPNLAMWEAGKHADLCGISVVGVPLIAAGGFSYLHKDVPLLQWFSPANVNYFAAPMMQSPPDGWHVVKSFRSGYPGDYVLFRRDGGCAPPPSWYTVKFN